MASGSRVEGARKLQRQWFANDAFRKAVDGALDAVGFTEAYVDACTASGARGGKRKALKDTVWGMMEFDAPAMRLIDCPLLQRLRRIRQLGFSYLTYASAEHSRFPHSVGMAHVVSRFLASFEARSMDRDEMEDGLLGYRSSGELTPLRPEHIVHAALLHDVGHLPFSHATEGAIEASRDLFKFGGLTYVDFMDRAARHLQGSLSLSEALSLVVVLSPRFARFYAAFVSERADPDAPLYMACLIAGQRASETCGNIQDIVSSSAVDSDKIDYVTRDAQACGISTGVDVSRIFLGSSLVGLTEDKARALGYGGQDRVVFTLNASGWDTFDEIIRARSTLYQRVYLHAVTRTAEAMLSRSLKLWAVEQRIDVLELWTGSDDQMLTSLSDAARPLEVRFLGEALRNRHLPKKACALGGAVLRMHIPMGNLLPRTFGGPGRVAVLGGLEKAVAAIFQKRFSRSSSDVLDSVGFEDEVTSEANRIAALLRTHAPDLAPSGHMRSAILINIAALDRGTATAPVYQHGELVTADAFTNVRGTSDASDLFRQNGYVMAPQDWREIALVATRNVLFKHSLTYDTISYDPDPQGDRQPSAGDAAADRVFGPLPVRPLTILDVNASIRRVGASRAGLARMMDALAEAGDFDDTPVLAPHLKDDDAIGLADMYGQFDGQGGWRVTKATIRAFVEQFPPGMRHDMIRCLTNGRNMNREAVGAALSAVVRRLAGSLGSNLVVVPMSISSGGAAFSDLRSRFDKGGSVGFLGSLDEALRVSPEGTAFVLVDDNSASGTQSRAQLHQFMNPNRDEWPASLRSEGPLIDTLDEAGRRRLREAPLAIAVALGHQTAAERLKETARELGIGRFAGLHHDQAVAGDIDWPAGLKAHLTEIGRQLVARDRYGQDFEELMVPAERDACERDAFGYGGFGGVTVLPSTVPTSTVTALWLPGTWRGRPWLPLAVRWGRFARTVFF